MESARRWSGYVCPDCRFVFRVPRDHDGKGIVCPSCRRMMRIPAAGDIPPPLLATVRRVAAVETPASDEVRRRKKHRRGKGQGGADSPSWERDHRGSRSGRSERRQLRMILVGGAILLAAAIGGGVVFMNRGGKLVTRSRSTAPLVSVKPEEKKVEAAAAVRGDASLLIEAEPLVTKFLKAKSVDEILPLVRNREVAEPRMRAFYPQGKIDPPGIAYFNSGSGIAVRGNFISIPVTTADLEVRQIALMDGPDGLKIDWESWVRWSDISLEQFMGTKPSASHVFRVTLSTVDYYNFAFTDDSKWRSFRLLSADGEESLYGYALRGSVLDVRLQPPPESRGVPFMLALKYPPNASSRSQVEIESFVADGWVEPENSP